jgi:hypothetical protein
VEGLLRGKLLSKLGGLNRFAIGGLGFAGGFFGGFEVVGRERNGKN